MEKMSNIIDYVRRMKDVPFEIAPLNEIDSLIFSQLAYLDYSLLPTKESYSFLEIYNSNLVNDTLFSGYGTWYFYWRI